MKFKPITKTIPFPKEDAKALYSFIQSTFSTMAKDNEEIKKIDIFQIDKLSDVLDAITTYIDVLRKACKLDDKE